MNDLERQYLIAAHGLAMQDARRTFNEDEIANYIDLDPNEPGYADRFVATTASLLEMGFLGRDSKGLGMGRRTLKLTRTGVDEAERLTDPLEQKKELRRSFLRAVYDQADTNPGGFVYWRDLADNFDLAGMERPPTSMIPIIEYLQQVGFISIEDGEATMYRITAKGVDEVEDNRREPQPSVTNYDLSGSTFYQAAVGNQNTNTFSGDLDFSTVERRIDAEGGADREELRELIREMRELLESGQTVDKGFLARWNDKLKEYDWLSNAVAGWLLNFATQ